MIIGLGTLNNQCLSRTKKRKISRHEEASHLKNTLSNLSPLQYDLSISAAQKLFLNKTDIYKREVDKPKSAFATTLRFAKEGSHTDWTLEAIKKEYLVSQAADLLNLLED